MAVAVEMPKLGNTVEECLITKWLKKTGDTVAADEPVLEIETDKTNFEVTAPVAGTLLATFFGDGDLVPVFNNLFVVGKPGEDVEAFRPASGSAGSAAENAGSQVPTKTESNIVVAPTSAAGQAESSAPLSPRARRFAEEHNFHPDRVRGSGPGGRVLEADLRGLYMSSPRLSGAAAAAAGGNARGQSGSGIGGMVLSSDLASGNIAGGNEATRISGIREKIARRMRESLANTAQYTLSSSANASGLMLLRAKVKATPGAADVNISDLVAYCTVQALLEVPSLNARFVDGVIESGSNVHLGFACDTPRGLLVPVVHNAHAMSAAELAARMKELAAQAVKGSIAVDDLSGGTFTVSNLGSFGIESFTPLVNPPQVAILGVNAIQLKPLRRDGRVEFIDSIGLSLTLDHQIIDGAPGARFLKVVRQKIENVENLCTI